MENIANIVRSALNDVPTELEEEIAKLTASDVKLPKTPKRNILDRIFVNRDFRLDRIKWIGYDMDYTLAVYNSPQYESLAYDLMITRLVEMGYPSSINNLKYDPSFAARGLLFDTQLGHLLKIDTFGNILLCVHGRQQISKKEIATLYPSFNIPTPEIGRRFHPLPSLFNLPEACLYADLIEFFENKSDTGIFQIDLEEDTSPRNNPIELTMSQSPVRTSSLDNHNQGFKLSYINLFQDVRAAMDHVHLNGALKESTLKDMDKYIRKTPKTAVLFDRFRKSGIKLFLLTNSEYHYTNQVMSYLLNNQNPDYKSWTDYFDVIIVSAGKPTFFGQGTTLREVNLETGHLKIGAIDKFLKGHVYSGGSIALFDRMTGAKGNQVLYIGDHIFADIIKSKKIHAWRNMLVIPELERELRIWEQNRHLYNQLHNLEFAKAEIFRNLTSEATQPPNISNLRKQIKETIEQINTAYNPYFGSLFSNGSKHSMFSMQVARYADLYTYDYLNLLNYPLFYHFSATYYTLPHQYSDPQ